MKDNGKTTCDSTKAIAVCNDMSVNLFNAGEFIEPGYAKDRLQDYFDAEGTPPRQDNCHIYGHTFGLGKVRELLFNIDTFNGQLQPGEKQLKGIRLYYAVSQRNDPDFPLDPPDGWFRDLIFMPVLEDGNDVYDINKLANSNLILSASRPCPNQCGFCFIDKLK